MISTYGVESVSSKQNMTLFVRTVCGVGRFILSREDLPASHHNNDYNNNWTQPGLGARGASLSSPGRLVLSNFRGAGHRLARICELYVDHEDRA